jgi:hypothetical protein
MKIMGKTGRLRTVCELWQMRTIIAEFIAPAARKSEMRSTSEHAGSLHGNFN